MNRSITRVLLSGVAAFALLFPLTGVAHAATFVVTITGDTNDVAPGDGVCMDKRGNCSLRAAVEEANALAGADTIELLPGAVHRLKRAGAGEDAAATGDLDVTDDLTINGNGSIVDATGIDRHFDNLGVSLGIDNVALRNGNADGDGGAIRSTGSLTVTRSQLVRNHADVNGGAINQQGGFLDISDTVINQNDADNFGGGIEVRDADGLIAGTLIANNTAFDGGGMCVFSNVGTVTITDSTFQDNTATNGAGALYNFGGAAVVLENSLIRRNTSFNGGGFILVGVGSLRLTNSDVLNNAADPTSGLGGGIAHAGGVVRVNGGSIVADNSAAFGGGIFAQSGQTTVRESQLRDNTATFGGAAFTFGFADPVTRLRVISSTVIGNEAGTSGGGLFADNGSRIRVQDSVVTGNLAHGTAADQGGGGLYASGGVINIFDSAISANAATSGSGSGGGLLNNGGTSHIEGSRFYNNSAPRAGGGIESASDAAIDLFSTIVDSNSAGINGGGLHVTGAGTTTVTDGRVSANLANEEGGGLWNGSGTMTVTRTIVQHNEARGDAADQGGGGLFNAGGTLEVFDAVVDTNAATGTSGSGGGILNDEGTLTVDNTKIRHNSAVRAGGGIESDVGTNTITNVRARGNTTGSGPGNGGFFHATGAAVSDLLGVDVQGNDAANEGGGIWCPSDGDTEITGTVTGNLSPVGPNVFFQLPGAGTCTLNGAPVPPGPPGV